MHQIPSAWQQLEVEREQQLFAVAARGRATSTKTYAFPHMNHEKYT